MRRYYPSELVHLWQGLSKHNRLLRLVRVFRPMTLNGTESFQPEGARHAPPALVTPTQTRLCRAVFGRSGPARSPARPRRLAGLPSREARTRRCAKNTEGGRRNNNKQGFPYEPLVMGWAAGDARGIAEGSSRRPGRGCDYRGHARCGGEALARIGGQATPQANGIEWTMAS